MYLENELNSVIQYKTIQYRLGTGVGSVKYWISGKQMI